MSFHAVSGEASSISPFIQEWKYVEDQLELTKFSLVKYGQGLDLNEATKVVEQRNQEVELKAKEVEAMLDDLQSESKHIFILRKLIQDLCVEFTFKERELDLARKEVNDCNGMLRMKRKELEFVQKELEECNIELTSIKQQLGSIEKSIDKKNELLKAEEVKLGCSKMKVKNDQLELAQNTLQGLCNEIEMKEKEVVNLKVSARKLDVEIELKQKELSTKKRQLATISESLEERKVELNLEDTKLVSVKEELDRCCQDLSVKTEQLESVEKDLQVREKEVEKVKTYATNYNEELHLKKRELAEVKISIRDCNSELEVKQKQLEMLQDLTKKNSAGLDSKVRELCAIENSIDRCQNGLDLKRKEFDTTQRMIQECSKELDLKQKKLIEVQKEIEESSGILSSKKKDLDSTRVLIREKAEVLEAKQKHFDSLKKALEERSRKLEMKEKQFETRLKEFQSKKQHFDASYQNRQALEPRRNTLSPIVTVEEHEPDNSATVISQSSTSINEKPTPLFLTDVMGHDLATNEVLHALMRSPDPAKLVLDVMQESISQLCKNGGAWFVGSVKSKILLMDKLIEVSPIISPYVKAQAAELAVSWKANLSLGADNSSEVWAFLLFLAAYRLARYFRAEEILNLVLIFSNQRDPPNICWFLDIKDKIPEIIQILIGRKQHLIAARFSSAFGLLNVFPLESILQSCADYIKAKAIDEELDAIKAVLQCGLDYKVEGMFDAQNMARRIHGLEIQKQQIGYSSLPQGPTLGAFPTPFLQQHNQNVREGYQHGGNYKRPRLHESVNRFNSTGSSRQ